MLINNFGDLKAVLSSYMFHARFTPNYDLATRNFEMAANRRLRVRQMEAQAALPVDVDGVAPLPADYLVWRSVLWDNASIPGYSPRQLELDYVHPAYLKSTIVSRASRPAVFTIEGNNLSISPPGTAVPVLAFHYYRKIPTITGTNTDTNWLLTDYPDAYEFGAVTELFALGRNLEAAQLWKARRDETLAEIIQLSALTAGATSPQVRTAEYF